MNKYEKEIVCAASALKGETPIVTTKEEKAMVLNRIVMALNHLVRVNSSLWKMFDHMSDSFSTEEKSLFLAEKERYKSATLSYSHVRDMISCFLKFASEDLNTGKNEDAVREIHDMIREVENNTEELRMVLEWYRSAFLPCELISQ